MSSSEIHKKLKVAIGRRLRELEVYVDDELPDYVMVMVANKKDKKSMKNDLNLFLSGNTETFVDWLFDVIDKLQNARASSSPKEEKKKEISDKGKEEEKDKKYKEEIKNEKERARKDSDGHRHQSKSHRKSVDREESDRKKEKERHRVEEKAKPDRKRIDFPTKDVDFSGERRDRDRQREKEREKRQKEEREREKREKEERERERKESERKAREREEEEKRARKEEEEKRSRKEEEEMERRARKDEEERAKRREEASQKRARERERETREREIARQRRERSRSNTWSDDENDLHQRALSSSANIRRDAPHSISSQISVKRKVPTTRDPKEQFGISSLLKRAMNDANLSAAAGYGAPAQTKAPPQPILHKQRNKPKPTISEETMIVNAVRAVSSQNEAEKTNFTVTMNNVSRPRAALKRKQEHIARRDASPVEFKEKKVRPRITAPEPQPNQDSEEDEDMIDRAVEQSTMNNPPPKNPSPIVWDGQINLAESEMSEDDEAEIDAVLASTQRNFRPIFAEEDVLPPTHQLSRGNSYHSNYSPMSNSPVPQYIPTPIFKAQMSCSEDMAFIDGPISNTQLGTAKVNEKCRFWPNCARDDASCPYIHPSKQCMAFPNCAFGNRCMYIHPPCRYNTRCQNPTCHFTHSSNGMFPAICAAMVVAPRVPAPLSITAPPPIVPKPELVPVQPPADLPIPSAPGQARVGDSVEKGPEIPMMTEVTLPAQPTISCRFKGQCKKINCPYKHPATCRFGDQCLNPACFFYHPQKSAVAPVPKTAGKYKWQATSQATTA